MQRQPALLVARDVDRSVLEVVDVDPAAVEEVALDRVAGVRKVMEGVKRTGSMRAVQQDVVPLEEYYELVGLPAMTKREEAYAAAAKAVIDKLAKKTPLKQAQGGR